MPDSLSPAMSAALETIRTQDVTYAYRPMPHADRRPVPVTSRDLAPLYSHGLHGGTVGALLRRSLVQLSPTNEKHGRVLPATKE